MDMRDAKKASERQAELLNTLWGMALGETHVHNHYEEKDPKTGARIYEMVRAYERTVGGWIYHINVGNYVEDRNEWEQTHTTTFIPFKPREEWDT